MYIAPYQFVDFVIKTDLAEKPLNAKYDWCRFIL